ncbi:hypothetical protein AB0M86_29360 [Streptomyces sp. NPDC051639]|uniref:hypothetical protein n=1 Tax=Streptomyces sp. NPDC051639 TaxID=3155671 RepID=UPI003431CD16
MTTLPLGDTRMDMGDDLRFEKRCAELEAADHQEYLQIMAELGDNDADPNG